MRLVEGRRKAKAKKRARKGQEKKRARKAKGNKEALGMDAKRKTAA